MKYDQLTLLYNCIVTNIAPRWLQNDRLQSSQDNGIGLRRECTISIDDIRVVHVVVRSPWGWRVPGSSHHAATMCRQYFIKPFYTNYVTHTREYTHISYNKLKGMETSPFE